MPKKGYKKRRDQETINIIGSNIRRLRKLNSWTISELAFKMNIDAAALGKMERGEVDSTVSMISLAAKALSVKVSVLYGES